MICDGSEAVEQQGKRRRLLRKTASSVPEVKDFVYVRNFQDLVRTRAYVQGQGAQRLTRRMLSVLCPSTCDLDICNAVFVVLHQLAVRLHLDEAIPGAAFQALTKLAVNRAGVCKDDLRLTVKEGKQVLHSVLFGGIVPTALRDNEFMRSFQRLSIILRWTACSLLPDVYERTKAMKSKTHPESSTLFYLYAAAEDFILEAWENYVALQFQPKHVSLHFDGLRIHRSAFGDKPVDAVCRECEEAIASATGFKVSIVEKKHECFRDICRAKGQLDTRQSFNGVLSNSGNCILRAMAYLYPNKRSNIFDVLSGDTEANKQAVEHGSRSYSAVIQAMQLHAVPCLGFGVRDPGKYLLHVENNGRPHCIACEACDNNEIVLGDTEGTVSMSWATLMECWEASTDSSTLVTFRLFENKADIVWPEQRLRDNLDMLLDLHAGASQGREEPEADAEPDDHCEFLQCEALLPDDEDDCPAGEPGDEEGRVTVSSNLLQMLQSEVNEYLQCSSTAKKCPFCPFRQFPRCDRLRQHVTTYHTAARQFVCSGTKQVKVISALFDHDQVVGHTGKSYLRRSAYILADTVRPSLSKKSNEIDRFIRLVLTGQGPLYKNLDALQGDDAVPVRRARNLYYTRDFAELVYQEILLCNAKCKAATRLC